MLSTLHALGSYSKRSLSNMRVQTRLVANFTRLSQWTDWHFNDILSTTRLAFKHCHYCSVHLKISLAWQSSFIILPLSILSNVVLAPHFLSINPSGKRLLQPFSRNSRSEPWIIQLLTILVLTFWWKTPQNFRVCTPHFIYLFILLAGRYI